MDEVEVTKADLEKEYITNFKTFLRVAMRITGNVEDAQDAVQNAFTKLIKGHNRIRIKKSLHALILRAVIYASISLKESEKKGRELLRNIPPSKKAEMEILRKPEDWVEDTDLWVKIVEVAAKYLSNTQIELFAMRYHDMLTIKEIADLLSVPKNTVKGNFFRIREILRKKVEQLR